MFILKETVDRGGYYHQCRLPSCVTHYSTCGSSPSPGFFAERPVKRCPRCEHLLDVTPLPAPYEVRVVRTSDGVVVQRFPKTPDGRVKAEALVSRLMALSLKYARPGLKE